MTMLPIVKQLNLKRIVLASSSPRRKELLQNIVRNWNHNQDIMLLKPKKNGSFN